VRGIFVVGILVMFLVIPCLTKVVFLLAFV
jgi:hypothetical protein